MTSPATIRWKRPKIPFEYRLWFIPSKNDMRMRRKTHYIGGFQCKTVIRWTWQRQFTRSSSFGAYSIPYSCTWPDLIIPWDWTLWIAENCCNWQHFMAPTACKCYQAIFFFLYPDWFVTWSNTGWAKSSLVIWS